MVSEVHIPLRSTIEHNVKHELLSGTGSEDSANENGKDGIIENGLPFSFGLGVTSSIFLNNEMKANDALLKSAEGPVEYESDSIMYRDEAPELVKQGAYLLPKIYSSCMAFIDSCIELLSRNGISCEASSPILRTFLKQAVYEGFIPRASQEYLHQCFFI